MEWLTGKKEKLSENKSSSVDGIVMKKFVERFNQKYNSSQELESLVENFIFSSIDLKPTTCFKVFLKNSDNR